MSCIHTLVNGEQESFKPATLTPMQKMILRFVVVGLVYYGIAVVEGMIMRLYEIAPIPTVDTQQFFAIMTAHPLVGIFGSTYSIVFGAFLFLVPFLMKKPLWSIPLGNWTCGLLAVGTFTFWFAGFLSEYAPLYTLYWPLPADFTQFSRRERSSHPPWDSADCRRCSRRTRGSTSSPCPWRRSRAARWTRRSTPGSSCSPGCSSWCTWWRRCSGMTSGTAPWTRCSTRTGSGGAWILLRTDWC